MARLITTLALAIVLTSPLAFTRNLHADEITQPGLLFKDIFLTAGYSSVLGALLGASAMFIVTDPLVENVRWIGVGASLGFVSGTILGSYLTFGPMFTTGGAMITAGIFNFDKGKMVWRLPQVGLRRALDSQLAYHTNVVAATF